MNYFDTYQSPFSWRYGSQQMRTIWSENKKRIVWRSLWYYLAKTQMRYNVIPTMSLDDIENNIENINIDASLEKEIETKHDLMAELFIFSSQCGESGKFLHNCATSMDIKDNTDIILMKESLIILEYKLKNLLNLIASIIEKNKDIRCIGYTHLQPAEATTIGYRFSNYYQDILEDYENIKTLSFSLKAKGFKGSVGTGSPYVDVLGLEKYKEFLSDLEKELGVNFFDVSTQTYTRKQDYRLMSTLSSFGLTAHKIALDLRILQSYNYGEILEDFSELQIGSSAMPFKKNPITAEKICSLSRELFSFSGITWENGANSILERTLDDSANRRNIIPEAFLISEEIIISLHNLLENMTFNYKKIKENYDKYISFSIADTLMSRIVSTENVNRQEIYKKLQEISFMAFENNKDFIYLLCNDKTITKYINPQQIKELYNNLDYAINQTKVFSSSIL